MYKRENPFKMSPLSETKYSDLCKKLERELSSDTLNMGTNRKYEDLAVALAEAFASVANVRKACEHALPLAEVSLRSACDDWTSPNEKFFKDSCYYRYKFTVSLFKKMGNWQHDLLELTEPCFVRTLGNQTIDDKRKRAFNMVKTYGMNKPHLNPGNAYNEARVFEGIDSFNADEIMEKESFFRPYSPTYAEIVESPDRP